MIDTNRLAGIAIDIEYHRPDKLDSESVEVIREAIKELWALRGAANEIERLRANDLEQAQMLVNQANTIQKLMDSELALKRELSDTLEDWNGRSYGLMDDERDRNDGRIRQLEKELSEGGS